MIFPLCFKIPLKALKPSSCPSHAPLLLFTHPACTVLPSPVSVLTLIHLPGECPASTVQTFLWPFPIPSSLFYFSPLFRTTRSVRLLGFSLLSITEVDSTCSVFMTNEARTWHMVVFCSTFKLVDWPQLQGFGGGEFCKLEQHKMQETRNNEHSASLTPIGWQPREKDCKACQRQQSQTVPHSSSGGITEQS